MQTIDFEAIQPAPMLTIERHGLLCRNFRSPAEVSFFTPFARLAGSWRPVRTLWEQDQQGAAIAMLNDAALRRGESACVRIPTLFLLAQMRIEENDHIGAERCLQSSVSLLAQQTGELRMSSVGSTSRMSLAGTSQPYALGGREWLILAIQALLKSDIESCFLWIRQADRCALALVAGSESHRRLMGDLHAVRACAAAQIDEMDVCEQFLAAAYEQHVQAEAYRSVCRDLILTSRLAMLQGQLDRAHSLLDAAECQLVIALSPDALDGSRLLNIIASDRMKMADTSHEYS